MSRLRFGFAGDRDIAVWVLDHVIESGVYPSVLLVPDEARQSHATQLVSRCESVGPCPVLYGDEFRSAKGIAMLADLSLDLLICVHFPYLVPASVLSLFERGTLNLHPALLPYNRGWHTPSWAILEGTPAGATLHFMDEGLDTGAIVHQLECDVSPGATADSLYSEIKACEYEVFVQAWPRIIEGDLTSFPQSSQAGSCHRRSELFRPEVQRLDLNSTVCVGELLRKLRALTTNQIDEAAYYEVGGKRYRVRIDITEESI